MRTFPLEFESLGLCRLAQCDTYVFTLHDGTEITQSKITLCAKKQIENEQSYLTALNALLDRKLSQYKVVPLSPCSQATTAQVHIQFESLFACGAYVKLTSEESPLVRTLGLRRTDRKYHFVFTLAGAYAIDTMRAAEAALKQNVSIAEMRLYEANRQYLVITAKTETDGLYRKYFKQARYKGASIFEQFGITIDSTWKSERALFDACPSLVLIYGNPEPLR